MLISEAYKEQNKQLHETRPDYGISGAKYAEHILEFSRMANTRDILDYGCGKGLLAKNLDFPIWEYDPAIELKRTPPRPADLVC